MNKMKKIVINLAIIVIILLGIYHFGGFYVSKEKCVEDYIRGQHIELEEPAMEIKESNMIYTIYVTEEKHHLALITQKIGFLYRAKGYCEMSGDTHNVTVSWFETVNEKGYIVVAERNDDSIAKANVLMMLGFTDTVQLTFDEWNNNIAATYVEGEKMNFATYQTYDEAGNLIEDLWGDGVGIVQ